MIGRAALQPLLQREFHDESSVFSAGLHDMLEFLLVLLRVLPTLRMPVVPDETPPLVVFTDAMYRP